MPNSCQESVNAFTLSSQDTGREGHRKQQAKHQQALGLPLCRHHHAPPSSKKTTIDPSSQISNDELRSLLTNTLHHQYQTFIYLRLNSLIYCNRSLCSVLDESCLGVEKGNNYRKKNQGEQTNDFHMTLHHFPSTGHCSHSVRRRR